MSSCVTRVCGRTIIMWDDSCLQENLIHSLEKELMKRNTILFIWLLKKDRGRTNHIIATFLHQDLFCTGLILHFSIMWHPDAPSVTQSWQKKQWAVKNVFLLTYSVNTMSGRLCHNCFFFKGMRLKSMSISVDGCVHVGTGKGSSLQMSYLENNVWCLWWYILVCMYYYQVIRQRLRNGNPSVRPGSQPKGMMNKERVMVPFLKFHFSRKIV